MIRIAVYSVTTGTILRIVTCSESMAAIQAGLGEAIIAAPAEVTDTSHRVEDGVLVPVVNT